jgi:ABC-2 type transport system permease protein
MNVRHAARAFAGITRRELLRFLQQRGRLVSALVRPLLWLLVFAAGFRAVLGVSIVPPYQTYIPYELYIAPGLIGMVQLFNGMQSSLAMVYDRELGSMRLLLTVPLPRSFLLVSKLIASTLVSIVQVYAFLAVAALFGVTFTAAGYVAVIPALFVTGLMLGAVGLLLSSFIRQLENFAGVMNFVIFPAFFLSSALYPLWKLEETSRVIYLISAVNPFTHAVEFIRFSLYLQVNAAAAGWSLLALVAFTAAAVVAYDPRRGLTHRQVA